MQEKSGARAGKEKQRLRENFERLDSSWHRGNGTLYPTLKPAHVHTCVSRGLHKYAEERLPGSPGSSILPTHALMLDSFFFAVLR
jgi:hypothetical protein